MKKNLSLIIIGIFGFVISLGMCVFLGIFMSARSIQTMNEIGELLMTDIGAQSITRYDAVLAQRLAMVEGLNEYWKPDWEGVNEDLVGAAQARGLSYLAFMDENGELEFLIKDDFYFNDATPFIDSVAKKKENKIAVGTTVNGEESIVLFGVPTINGEEFDMENGNKSAALIAGIGIASLREMLTQNNPYIANTKHLDMHIIRRGTYYDDPRSGTYVMHPSVEDEKKHAIYSTYYDQVRGEYNIDVEEREERLKELHENMLEGKKEQPFSTIAISDSRKLHIFAQRIDNTEWYLMVVMDYEKLSGIVGGYSKEYTLMTLLTCFVILMSIGLVFFVYYWQSKHNIKELKLAKSEAENANKAKSEFLSNMSHDIRTPMNAIVGMTTIALNKKDDKEQVRDCLKKISLSSRHLLGLINDVLDMSKIESGKMTLNMEKTSLNEIIEGVSTVIQPQIKTKKQNFDVSVHDIISESVYCDTVRLNQVLLNLLSNAYKFTPEGGKIELSLWQEPIAGNEKFVRTHITVQDNGIGMSEEFKGKIFESFARDDHKRVHKTEGTGLGMTITKFIVDAMNGTIDVDSKQGEGTKFHITVDFEIADIDEKDMRLPNWNMLVVDDDAALCETTIDSLKDIGVNADYALDGETAVEMAVKASKSHKSYDAILIDWKLPGIDGVETVKRIRRELDGKVPILFISAYDCNEITDKANEVGVNGFLAKPLFKSSLFHCLKQFSEKNTEDVNSEKEQAAKTSLNGKRILIAEDNDINWEIAEMLLTDEGLICERAENGRECADIFKNSAPGTYDAILMDLRMPIMNGLESTEEIRACEHPDKNLPIIAMTADAFSDDVKKCLDSGMNAHISKPIDIATVKSVLIKFIGQRD